MDKAKLSRAALIAAAVLLVAANAFLWPHAFQRRASKSVFGLQQVTATATAAPSAVPSAAGVSSSHSEAGLTSPPPPAPSAAAEPLKLPDTQGRPLVVSIIGDSLATGRFASTPDMRYRALVLGALQSRGPMTTAEAVRTTGEVLSTAVNVPAADDVVIVALGTDDMARTDSAGFAAAYSKLVKAVRAASPKAALVCAGTWSDKGGDYDDAISRACTDAGGRFVALRGLYEDPKNRGPAGVVGYYGTSDDAAPNDAGHRAIAKALLEPLGLTLS